MPVSMDRYKVGGQESMLDEELVVGEYLWQWPEKTLWLYTKIRIISIDMDKTDFKDNQRMEIKEVSGKLLMSREA